MTFRNLLPVLLLGALLISCGDDNPSSPTDDPPENPNTVSQEIGPDGGEITSSDGDLTLTFPEGALPSPETITITPLSEDELGEEFQEIVDSLGIANAYEMGPDGLEFDEPVVATMPSDQNSVLNDSTLQLEMGLLLTSSDGQIEALDSLRLEPVSSDSSKLQVSGTLSHFSEMMQTDESNLVTARVTGVPDELEKNKTTTVKPRAEIKILPVEKAEFIYDHVQNEAFNPPNLPEDNIFDLLDISSGEGLSEFERSITFICEFTGPDIFNSDIKVTIDSEQSELLDVDTITFKDLHKDIICVEAMPETFKLLVQKDGAGDGTVTSDPAGINFGDDSMQEYEEGTDVTLTASPDENSTFDGWSGDTGDANTQDSTLTVTMDSARTVTATFGKKDAPAKLTRYEVSEATGTDVTIDWEFEKNSDGSIDDIDLRFDWGDGTSSMINDFGEPTGDDPQIFDRETNHTYEHPGEYDISGSLEYEGELLGEATIRGFVTPAPPKITGVNGEFIDLSTIDLSYQIQWLGSTTALNATFDGNSDGDNLMDVPIEQGNDETTIKIEYKIPTDFTFPATSTLKVINNESGQSNSDANGEFDEVTLTVDKEGQGTVTGDVFGFGKAEIINCGEDCQEKLVKFSDSGVSIGFFTLLTATPADGFDFVGWSGDTIDENSDTICLGTGDCEVEMTQDRTITAMFEKENMADLSMQINGPPDGTSVAPGEETEVEVRIFNTDGPDPAQDLEYTVQIDNENGTITDTGNANCEIDPMGIATECTRNELGVPGALVFTFTTVPEEEGTQTLSGQVTSATFDPDPENNTAEEVIDVEKPPESILDQGIFNFGPDVTLSKLEEPSTLFLQALFGDNENEARRPGYVRTQTNQQETEFGVLSGTFPVAFSGSGSPDGTGKILVIDLLTEELLLEIDTGIDPIFGVTGVATEPGNTESDLLVAFGNGIGNFRTNGGGTTSLGGTTFDVVPAGGNTFSGGYIEAEGSVDFQAFDPESGLYSLPGQLDSRISGTRFEDDRIAVSAWVTDRPDDRRPALAVGRNSSTLESSLFLVTRDGNDPVRVADIGQDARKIRCTDLDDGSGNLLCGVSVFGEDQIALFSWDGTSQPSAIGTLEVGDGPVNLDVKLLDSGNIGLITSGFNDNSVAIFELMPGGGVVSQNTQQAPSACQSPAHTKFIQDSESLKILGTCFDSGNYFIIESGL